ncbi:MULTISPECIES: DEAD/DEAH box helicase [Pseudomonas]|uniref:DEAD/DEAH box helicase n=1 Tax=Pseudomonas TaxID=286 RepID=UPI00190E4CAC|nr:helicase-related protein [Pseudomonas sp. CCI1.1]MBK3433102.1 ATP-dependent helicase [Pseudomonas fluorescens]MBK3483697.1 ATP-dependent helicase [Pseudomonas fluorescens]MEB0191500.1 helicase-related protein [Pseudomonas sp. CCI1.1]WPX46150.1 helicase-related protein [Pseudomonas sp. CCI1.1]
MANLLTVSYKQTGKSSNLNSMGMREMQARAFESRDAQYLLLKAPPASGKSRALMFLGLDKLHNQGLKKVIVAVPEMSIGGSFKNTKLTEHGFFTDWTVASSYNLCIPGGEQGKVNTFIRFMSDPDAQVLVCTHATLRFAYQKLTPSDFNDCLLAIDEFHHTSADGENRLGELIDGVMNGSSAHIIAMTGSYFRGDAVPILLPEDEDQFTQVTYSYYEQLNGYQHLKSLGIGYHFYTGRYLDALHEVLDTSKKTIVHIPNVNSVESTKDKYSEVDHILDVIGAVVDKNMATGIITVRDKSGRLLKVADLVDDNPQRVEVQNYLRNVSCAEDMDIIIALGMAKEGFDWPWCEHVLTVGYRSSLTEIIQIIGRATRDSEGKPHAQFTNLIAQPDAEDDDVKVSVNNMLKAITVSLLMEQVLAPSVNFKPRSRMLPGEQAKPGTVIIEDTTAPVSDKVIKALENMDNIKAAILQKPEVVAPAVTGDADPQVLEAVEIPKIVEKMYPDMDASEVQTVSEAVYISMGIQSQGGMFDESELPESAEVHVPEGAEQPATPAGEQPEDVAGKPGPPSGGAAPLQPEANRKFVLIGKKFVNIEHLNVDLIRQINPFQGAYEILSKAVTPSVLKAIQDTVVAMRTTMSEEEAVILWPRINAFIKDKGREPSPSSGDTYERRLAEALAYIKRKAQERKTQAAQAQL